MPTNRRLTAAFAAAALGWSVLTLGVSAPAQAVAAPAAGSTTAGTGHRAPHDPATYYASAAGLSGNALALELNSIIDGNTFVPYTSSTSADVWKALKVLDQDPNNPNRVIDAYSGDSLDAANQCGSSCALDGWNREHTWAQSRGSFNTNAGPGHRPVPHAPAARQHQQLPGQQGLRQRRHQQRPRLPDLQVRR